jgi:hypothetical protein
MTMLSRTWLVQSTPRKKVLLIQPKLRRGPGPGSLTMRSSGVRSSCEALGSRRMAAALTRNARAVNQGSPSRMVLESNASAMPPSRAPSVKPTLSAEYM